MDTSALTFSNSTDLLEPAYRTWMGVVQKDIFLVINWVNREIYAETRAPEYTDIFAVEVRCNGREDAYKLPLRVDASRLRYWVEDEILPRIKPLIEAYKDVYYDPAEDHESRRFPGYEHTKIKFNEWMARAARPPRHSGGLMTADGWLDPGVPEVRADSTDGELKRLAEMIVAGAAIIDIIIDGGEDSVLDYLRDYRGFKALREARHAQRENIRVE